MMEQPERGYQTSDKEVSTIKILHCIAQLPTRTGSGIYYHNLLRQFAAETDWEQGALYALPVGGKASNLMADRKFPVFFGTPSLPFPMPGMSDEMPYPSTVYHRMDKAQIAAWKSVFRDKLVEIKRVFNPDVVISHHLWMLTELVLDVFSDRPIIGISHGTDIRQAKQHPDLCQTEVGSLRQLTRVLALSADQVGDLLSCFDLSSEQIVVTGGAIDTTLFRPTLPLTHRAPGQSVRLVYAGKMVESKGTFELVSAFHLALKSDPYLTLDLIGRETDALDDHIDRLFGSDERIRLYDVESQYQLATHFRRSDVFMFPSYYEGLGLVALEALASGLSLVTNTLVPLSNQLDRLASSAAISWVPMPRLIGLDRIDPDARAAYIPLLAEAILEQAACRRDASCVAEHPYQEMASFSWEALARRVRQLIGEL